MPHYVYSEPEERKFIVLPPGEYEFTIREVYALETSQHGNEMLPISLSIKHDGPDPVSIIENLVFTPKAWFKINQLLKSIGKAPAPDTVVNFDDPRWLLGSRGRCWVKIERYNGRDFNKIESFIFTPGTVVGRTFVPAQPSRPEAAPSRAQAPGGLAGTGTPAPEDNVPF